MQVIEITVVDEPFALKEINKHQAVEEDGGIPAALLIVGNSLDVFDELNVLVVELTIELFGDALNVQRLA